jgi:adenine-specific DNA-methyltransferase
MVTAKTRLKETLRSLFRYDHVECDFGIHRVWNQARADLERFVEQDLEDVVREALRSVEKDLSADDLERITHRVHEDLARFFGQYDADDGSVSIHRSGTQTSFGSAPHYDGEEVRLHWAHRNQYYVPMGEHFGTYRFTVEGITVQFRVVEAQDADPDTPRYAVPAADDPVSVNPDAKACAVAFAYRPISEAEGERLLQRYNAQQTKSYRRKTNDRSTIVVATTQQILDAIGDDSIRKALGGKEGPLRRHLNRYTAQERSNSFVHKDLGGTLRGQLADFVQQEVLDLDARLEGEVSGAGHPFARAQAVRMVGHRMIDRWATVEDYRKRLFQKKKFVVDTGYCVTLDHVPTTLYDDILESDAQLDEWQELYAIDAWDEDVSIQEFSRDALEAHPHLMVDTRHFEQAFEDTLLDHLSDAEKGLAGTVDGICIQGENFQALNLLRARYEDEVDCIYVDPPYNSQSTDILYENSYPHSTWLSMMDDRLRQGRQLLGSDGIQIVAVDEHEQERLGLLVEEVFPEYDRTCVTVEHNPRGVQGGNFSYTHEYAYFLFPADGSHIRDRRIDEADWEYSNLRNWGGESRRTDGRNCFYPIVVADGEIVRLGEVPPDDWHPDRRVETLASGAKKIWPIDRNGVERKWRYTADSLRKVIDTVRVRTIRGELEVEIARSRETPRTVWTGSRYDAGTHGTRLLSSMLGKEKMPENPLFPKSIHTVEDCLDVSIDTAGSGQTVLDFFAGSGTTGHALMRLDEANGGDTTYVLVERGDYFNTVLLPRLKKAAFSDEWAEGVPQSQTGRSHVIKYHRLESYEDALSNLEDDCPKASAFRERSANALRYRLSPDVQAGECLLSLDAFERPFKYTLRLPNGVESPTPHSVDLERTFNYLLGLHVATRRVYRHQNRRYVVVTGTAGPEREKVMVVWRNREGLDLEAEASWAAETLPEGPFDAVYVNGPSRIHGQAEPVERPFRERMDSVAEGGGARSVQPK